MIPRLLSSVVLLALAGCAAVPVEPTPAAPAVPQAAATVATIRAAAAGAGGELDVQPLRDPQVEDLRDAARQQEAAGQFAAAVTSLDEALQLNPDDPALLQERAEAAVLVGDHAGAESFARRAFEQGSQLGPLCRRHWATVRQMRYLAHDGAGARAAQQQLDACRVAPPARY
ncbi:MAG: tetratricopeptide repeat protein [Pseudoxanthomonas suwonensis]|nr:tetratricopeptide repeat protein [Pseudoxanthomonas suwonensis]